MIVFDLDDTLYKEIDFWHSGMKAVARAAASAADAPGLYARMMSAPDPLADAITVASAESGIPEKTLVDVYRCHRPEITLDPEAAYVLATLRDRGQRLALITDGRSRTQRAKIDALGLARFIPDSRISISEEVGDTKKSPLPFERLMSLNPSEKEWTYVGDNPEKDFFHPNRLGWDTVMLDDNGRNIFWQSLAPGGEYAAKHRITTLLSLLDLII